MADQRPHSAHQRVVGLDVAGEYVELYPCGGLWWACGGVLVVSDLHLEKGSFFASRGQMLPPYDTRTTLRRLRSLLGRLNPERVVCLGDSFHDPGAAPRMAEEDARDLRAMTSAYDWLWIEGNHDPEPPKDFGGQAISELRLGGLILRHEPTRAGADGEIAGHLHPCARLTGRTGQTVRTRCFATDRRRLVMPAYGALTGGLNVLDDAFRPLFGNDLIVAVLGREGVYLAGADSLTSDRPSSVRRDRAD